MNLSANAKKCAFYTLGTGRHTKADFRMSCAFPTPSDAICTVAYRTFAGVMQVWKINNSNDVFKKSVRLRLLNLIEMS
jgi:hypothetical protein